jgi:hypothetical protein
MAVLAQDKGKTLLVPNPQAWQTHGPAGFRQIQNKKTRVSIFCAIIDFRISRHLDGIAAFCPCLQLIFGKDVAVYAKSAALWIVAEELFQSRGFRQDFVGLPRFH